jgi:hypothetical protein
MKEHAYIWAKVAQKFEIPIAAENELQLLYGFNEEKSEQLQDAAETIADAVEDGVFNQTIVPMFN